MANARKCDRCEKCFDPYEIEGMLCRFRNPMFQTANDIREGVIGKLMVNDTPDAWVDLCPECAEMFEAFMCGAEPPAKPVTNRKADDSSEWLRHMLDITNRWVNDSIKGGDYDGDK